MASDLSSLARRRNGPLYVGVTNDLVRRAHQHRCRSVLDLRIGSASLSLVPGAWDRHHHPLSDHGHIKFWSTRTLRALLRQAGFEAVRFDRVGRFPALAKSMIAVAEN